jgi:hypothetical protein
MSPVATAILGSTGGQPIASTGWVATVGPAHTCRCVTAHVGRAVAYPTLFVAVELSLKVACPDCSELPWLEIQV